MFDLITVMSHPTMITVIWTVTIISGVLAGIGLIMSGGNDFLNPLMQDEICKLASRKRREREQQRLFPLNHKNSQEIQ